MTLMGGPNPRPGWPARDLVEARDEELEIEAEKQRQVYEARPRSWWRRLFPLKGKRPSAAPAPAIARSDNRIYESYEPP